VTYPSDLNYTDKHEWVRFNGPIATVGITSYAADALGDIIYVDLDPIGSRLQANEPCGELESTKSVSELYAPVTGTVVEINNSVINDPSLINRDSFGVGWLFRVAIEGDDVRSLLDVDDYALLLKGE
jgi:glycine cleavage system H protein